MWQGRAAPPGLQLRVEVDCVLDRRHKLADGHAYQGVLRPLVTLAAHEHAAGRAQVHQAVALVGTRGLQTVAAVRAPGRTPASLMPAKVPAQSTRVSCKALVPSAAQAGLPACLRCGGAGLGAQGKAPSCPPMIPSRPA